MVSERIQRRIDRLLDQIEEAIERRDWSQVRELAQDVIALDRDNNDAQAFLEAAEQRLSVSGSLHLDQDVQSTSISSLPSPASNVAEQPTSFANGRYQVERFLGEGGKKKVYLAHDTTLDREVAFALIKTEGLDETSRIRIQREAQAMGRLGSHPHIVTVFDLGEEADQPFMVTELMGGGDVEGLIEDAPSHLLPIEQAVKIAKETCRGLEFAHSRGIVHRDLKPGNVWLTADGVSKIGDFGLAVSLDRSRLTQEGMMVGTVFYMPPEQAMGGEVTPKSDLYSVGAMLYEMVTGRPPFLGDDSIAIIGQHINTPPVAPTWHNGLCPRPLEALIMRLLAKDPSERPDSATDVLSALDAIDLSASPPSERGDEGISDHHALDSLASGVFVGRQREMGELKAALEDALSGRGRLVTLVGEPGIGKTRTALELATYAGLRQAQVLWGRCYEGEGAPPYWPWVQAIRSYVRDVDPEQLRSEMGAGAADIAEVVSDVREQLPGLQAPPQLEPEQARFRLFDSITAFLKSAARRKPLVLVLDDLHWADQPSLLLLEFVARELASARVMIIGTYRDMELSRQHRLSHTLGELNRERLFQRVLLRGLDQDDVGRFIELASGVTPPSGMVEAVHRQTEGNPLFVTEVVRLLVQEGEMTQEKAGQRDSWSVRIPEGVREVIGRRLDRLSERCCETLTIASVIGREFTLEHLGPLIEDLTEDRLLEVLEEALSARVIEELPRSVGRYQFTHALIQETLAGELSITRRVRLHARIAQVLEAQYGASAEAHAAELAHHFGEAVTVTGNEKFIQYSLAAGDRALAAYAYAEALEYFQGGLSAKQGLSTGTVGSEASLRAASVEPARDAETAGLLAGLGRAQAATLERNKMGEAVATLSAAFDYYAQIQDIDRVVAIAEQPFYPAAGLRIGQADLIGRAITLAPPDSSALGSLLSRHCRFLGIEEADYAGASEAFEKAVSIARIHGDLGLEASALADFANVGLYNLRWRDNLDTCRKAIDLASQVGDSNAEVLARYTAALSCLALGDPENMRRHTDAIMPLAETLRDRFWMAGALRCQESMCRYKGDWSDARKLNEQGLGVAAFEPRTLCNRALLEFESGEFVQGDLYLNRLLELMRSTPTGPSLEYAYPAAVIMLISRISGRSDLSEIAEEAARYCVSSQYVTPYVDAVARIGLGLLAVSNGDALLAKDQYDALEAVGGTMLLFPSIAGDRLLGLLAQSMGNLDRAVEHLEGALAFCRKAGYGPELAWTCCDYAGVLRERGGEGDHAKAITLLDESLSISIELGMRPLMERVLSWREILGA